MGSKELEYITAILTEGSFVNAAQKLYIAQPSLSQYIKRIEEKYGIEIFDRSTKPLELTHEGKVYLETERQIAQLKKERRQYFDDLSNMTKGHLRIGSSQYRSYFLLTKILPVFKARYPRISITLEEGTTAQLEEFALKGVTDFSLIINPATFPEMECREIFKEEVLLGVPRNHPLSVRTCVKRGEDPYPRIDLALFKDDPFIVMKTGQVFRRYFFKLCELANFKPDILLETHSIITAHALVGAEVALALIPDTLAKYHILQQKPCYFLLNTQLPSNKVVVAYNKNRYLSKAAQAFIAIMQEQLMG
ncbi:LysR family transcriptional regulator [Anaerosinus massiliensis]|uniref:LysR family transcriptional regulator n=1 Tax=Massilibacillus massiliensis TaxID=1806837 RepID=UPI0018FE5301|nr:LysR family transcriptional regulator [Massilibacillus massiliensis]